MIALLERDFVAVAANTRELQHLDRKSELGKFFWKVADKSKWKEQDGDTAQGHYAFSAAGDYYGSFNERGPEAMLAFLEKAKAKFAESPPAKLDLAAPEPNKAVEPPAGAATVRVHARIAPLPRGLAKDDMNRGVGRDHLWITKEEIAALARGLKDAEKCDLPELLVRRIARYHLLDDIRGEPDRWRSGEVKTARFEATRTGAAGTGAGDGQVHARIAGTFSLRAHRGKSEDGHKLGPRGYDGTLEGELAIDAAGEKLVRFALLAKGEAWGEGTYTGKPPAGKFPLLVAFVLLDAKAEHVVAPQGLDDGRQVYLAPPEKDD